MQILSQPVRRPSPGRIGQGSVEEIHEVGDDLHVAGQVEDLPHAYREQARVRALEGSQVGENAIHDLDLHRGEGDSELPRRGPVPPSIGRAWSAPGSLVAEEVELMIHVNQSFFVRDPSSPRASFSSRRRRSGSLFLIQSTSFRSGQAFTNHGRAFSIMPFASKHSPISSKT